MQRLNTIRFRLTIWNSIVVIVLASLSLFLTRQAMVYTLEQETRELLKEEVSELELAVNELYPDQERVSIEFSRKVLSHQRNQWFARLIDGNGNTLWESDNVPSELIGVKPILKIPFSFRKKENNLICWHSFESKSGESFTIVLGEPIDFIDRDLWNLTKVLLWIGLAVFIVAPIGGYLLAKSSMLPVQEIVFTTRKLKPSILEERLPIRGNGDELDQISAEINSFLDSNKRFLNSQREFIANAAHELRSPLTAIQTSAEVCLSKPRTPEEYREQLETVSEHCELLRRLVNQLLELAESDAGLKVNKEVFCLSDLVKKSISIFEGVAEEKHIAISESVTPNVFCHGDPGKLIQVINNLIDNSLKYSPDEGVIKVLLDSDEIDITLLVSDQGPGIPPEDLSRIFERFFRVDKSRNKNQVDGNGLGLSICKSIVELHGGKISCRNSTNFFEVVVKLPTLPTKGID